MIDDGRRGTGSVSNAKNLHFATGVLKPVSSRLLVETRYTHATYAFSDASQKTFNRNHFCYSTLKSRR